MTNPRDRQRQIERLSITAIVILGITHSLSGQDLELAGPAPASVDSSGQPLIVMGLDLSSEPFVRTEKDIPDIYESSAKQRADVFVMPLEKAEPAVTAANPQPPSQESIWLKYPTSAKRFYIEYRSDRAKPETERIYGPFAGDPFDRFRLEPVVAERLRSKYSPNDLLSIARMLKTQDAALSQRALRLAQAAIECQDITILESILADIRRALKENAATIKKGELQADADKLEEQMKEVDAKLEQLAVEIPDSQYDKAVDLTPSPPSAIPENSWSEAVNGLRAAAVPKQDTVAVGDDLTIILVVENTSNHDIKFSYSDVVQSARAEVVKRNHETIPTSTAWFSGWPRLARIILKPGERVAMASVSLQFAACEPNPPPAAGGQFKRVDPAAFGRTIVNDPNRAASSVYQVRYIVPLATGSRWQRGDDGVMRRVSPAKGEWMGTLTSGFVDFRVTDKQP